MKKFLGLLLTLALAFVLVGCGNDPADEKHEGKGYAEFAAAQVGEVVTIESYILAKTAKNDWGNVNLYLQDDNAAYYVYRMNVTDAQYDELVVGKRIKITGEKASWKDEIEFASGTATFEMMSGDSYQPAALNVTADFGSVEELIKHQNYFVAFKGLTIAADDQGRAWTFGWNGASEEGDDIYFYVELNGVKYQWLIESDLCGANSEVYTAAKQLKVGDTVDLEGFLYWYNGPQPHITKITVK